jgi:hypothetical protein
MFLTAQKTLGTYRIYKLNYIGTIDPKEATTDRKRDPNPNSEP